MKTKMGPLVILLAVLLVGTLTMALKSTIASSEPKTITKDTTIEDIATMMTEEKAYYLSVIEDGKIVGVITKHDLITAISKGKIW